MVKIASAVDDAVLLLLLTISIPFALLIVGIPFALTIRFVIDILRALL